MLIQALTSPWFGAALIIAGVSYAAFAKEPDKQVPKIVPVVGWAVISLCALLLGGAFITEEFLHASHIGEYVSTLTQDRHLTDGQKTILKETLGPLTSKFSRPLDVLAAETPEATGYAIELIRALKDVGIKIAVPQGARFDEPFRMRALSPIVRGVFFQVSDPKNPPEEARILSAALAKAGISSTYQVNVDYWIDNYALTVGLK